MNVVTISRKLAQKGELVVIPRREYEEFLRWKRAVRVRLDERWFWTPEWQKKEVEADEAIRQGAVSKPFSDHQKLTASLRRKKR